MVSATRTASHAVRCVDRPDVGAGVACLGAGKVHEHVDLLAHEQPRRVVLDRVHDLEDPGIDSLAVVTRERSFRDHVRAPALSSWSSAVAAAIRCRACSSSARREINSASGTVRASASRAVRR